MTKCNGESRDVRMPSHAHMFTHADAGVYACISTPQSCTFPLQERLVASLPPTTGQLQRMSKHVRRTPLRQGLCAQTTLTMRPCALGEDRAPHKTQSLHSRHGCICHISSRALRARLRRKAACIHIITRRATASCSQKSLYVSKADPTLPESGLPISMDAMSPREQSPFEHSRR